jgi:peptide-methionine (S)-S-oxide reductase
MSNRETGESSEFREAVFGGGCFWCIEATFSQLKGVRKVASGYAGGQSNSENIPSYDKVCSGKTGHAEVVRVEYDPAVISYNDLLGVFFVMHDPTTPNRQGTDAGTQYRSIILYSDKEQLREAEEFIQRLRDDKVFENPIVTEIKPLEQFYPAENYHQEYFKNNPEKPYCQFNISPKIAKLRKNFQKLLKE